MTTRPNKFLGAMLLLLAIVAWSMADCDEQCRMRNMFYDCKSKDLTYRCFYVEQAICTFCQPKGMGVCFPQPTDTPLDTPRCKPVKDSEGAPVFTRVWQYQTCLEVMCECELYMTYLLVEADQAFGDFATSDCPRDRCEAP